MSNQKRLFKDSEIQNFTTDQWYERLAAMEELRAQEIQDLEHLEKMLSGIDPSRYSELPPMLAEWPEEMRRSTAETAEFFELPKIAALLRQGLKRE